MTIECDLEHYKPEYLSELYKRATDLAKAVANMAAFATGYGIVVMIKVMVGPNGAQTALHRQEQIPPESRTAISLNPTRQQEFPRSLSVIVTEPSIFIALDDMIRAVTSYHTCAADCRRVVDRIRRIIAPTLDGSAAWQAVTGVIPDRVTTDGHDAYPQAIRMELGSRVRHRTNCFASSRIIVASRADVDRCSASRASHQQDDTAAVTTNSGTSSALDLACANTFPPARRFHYMRRTAIALGILEAA